MQKDVYTHIENILRGKPLSLIRRTCGMLIVHFGSLSLSADYNVGEVALHIQTYWRLLKSNALYTGEGDQRSPAPDDSKTCSLQPDRRATYLDYTLQRLFGCADPEHHAIFMPNSPYIVDCVQFDLGSIKIDFNHEELSIEVFACGNEENWRLFESGLDKNHIVNEGDMITQG